MALNATRPMSITWSVARKRQAARPPLVAGALTNATDRQRRVPVTRAVEGSPSIELERTAEGSEA